MRNKKPEKGTPTVIIVFFFFSVELHVRAFRNQYKYQTRSSIATITVISFYIALEFKTMRLSERQNIYGRDRNDTFNVF